MMRWLRIHPLSATAIAFALAVAAVVAIAGASGFAGFGNAWSNLHAIWILLVICAELLAIPAYALSYRALARFDDGPDLAVPLVIRVVIAGFGPFAAGGGFRVDKQALLAIAGDEREATVRVLGLGALEWALLAPAAWLSAVVLLVTRDSRAMSSLLWPWAVAVPVGFVAGLWLAESERTERFCRGPGRWRRPLGNALRSVGILRSLIGDFSRWWSTWAGMALYWTLDIAAFYASVRFIGLHPNLGEAVLAYATGYALTRRSMPLGGAGITEVLMTLSLHWVGQPIAPALAAVVVYRIFNFVLPTGPALLVRRHLDPLLSAAEQGDVPAPEERRRAGAPLGRMDPS
jgi:uncharacterized membrane protein YbhN (UPF0104 family)